MKTSFNLLSQLNESDRKEYSIKKKVIIESDNIKIDKTVKNYNSKKLNESRSIDDIIDDYTHTDDSFKYQMLGRLQMDCDYFLGYGNRYEGNLWAGNVPDQIKLMRALYDSFEDDKKPEWLTKEDIDNYEKEMKDNNLNEDAVDTSEEFFGHSLEDDIDEYEGPVPFDRFLQRAIDFGVEDEAFEKYGNRSRTNVNKLVREYYKDYKTKMNQVMKDNNLNEDTAETATFEIDYAGDDVDLSTEESVIEAVKNWLGTLANEVKIEVSELNGPAAGCPVVRLTGNKEKIAKFLLDNFNSGAEETLDDIYDLYLVKENKLKESSMSDIKDKYNQDEDVIIADAKADKIIKEYFNGDFDLAELHSRLEKYFGSKAKAAKYLIAREKELKIENMTETESPEAMQKIADKQMPKGGYRYMARHAVGPGTLPDDIEVLNTEETPNGKIAMYLSRPLTSAELKKYDIDPEWIQEDTTQDDNLNQDVSNLNENNIFSGVEFEKSIPHNMRFKDYEVLENPKDLFWVTQAPFDMNDLKQFQKALINNTPFAKAYVTVRDFSVYDPNEVNTKDIFAIVTANKIDATGYMKACEEEGWLEDDEKDPSTWVITESVNQDVSNLNESYIKVFEPDTNEYKKLNIACDELNKIANEKYNGAFNFTVEQTYFDYGQDWKWTTIMAHNPNKEGIFGSWQALTPRDQEILLTDYDIQDVLDKVANKTADLCGVEPNITEESVKSTETTLNLKHYDEPIKNTNDLIGKYIRIGNNFHEIFKVNQDGDKYVVCFASAGPMAKGGEFEPATLDEIKNLQLYVKSNNTNESALKESDWTITYLPNKTNQNETKTISVQANSKTQAVDKARQTIGDLPITAIGPLTEDDNIKIQNVELEPDYVITDVTNTENVGDGDVQSPDIDGLLTLVNENLTSKYGNWGRIKILSSNKNESSSFALVDITTNELLEEFKLKGIEDVAIGKSLILEQEHGHTLFKVNSLAGNTLYSKVTQTPLDTILEWVESEFLHEAMKKKIEEDLLLKTKNEEDSILDFINNRPELKMEVENIKMFIDLSKQIKAEDTMKSTIQNRMYGLAAEFPNSINITNKDDKYKLSFNNLDDVVEKLFGKDWVKIPSDDNKVVGTIKESYEQFNIGDIEVVFNPETFECLYSIPSADIKDKKINLADVPSVSTPYDTNTIIKSYIETKFGSISSNSEPNTDKTIDSNNTDKAIDSDNTDNTDINLDNTELHEDELPDEPSDKQPDSANNQNSETGEANFVKIRPNQPADLESVRARALDGDTPKSNYIVVDSVDLSPVEWNNFIQDLSAPQTFLENIKAIDRKNYSFNVVEITSSESNTTLLVDPLGYSYARYLAIKE